MAIWNIETSHMVDVPVLIEATSIPELRRRVQEIADKKKVRTDRPPIGELSFRYELDPEGEVTVVHSYFIDRKGKRRRFMRLRREQGALSPERPRRIMSTSNAITQ